MIAMTIGVVDVGSNTIRLLVASRKGSSLTTLREERRQLGLGEEIECTGSISGEIMARTAKEARKQARLARRLGADHVEVVVTAPGRRGANADALVEALGDATAAPVRVLSAQEEGCLAFVGALAGAGPGPEAVAVCDVGGGSTELVIGAPADPAWSRSLDLGSLNLTVRVLDGDPPSGRTLEAARAEVAGAFEGLAPPLPRRALATGGSARALGKLFGRTLGESQFSEAVELLKGCSSRTLAKRYGFDRRRAWTLPAGTLILAEIARRLALPLEVSKTGMREGVALTLLAELAAA
jgi:exopolyphosphatase/guanosine-5'-triphosphate,3'-diphosphate pyrophosphatase